MGHGELGDARPLPGGIDRDEAVHLAVEADLLDDLAPVGLEGAAVIVERHVEQRRDQPVGDYRGQPAAERVVPPRHPPAGDDIVALGELGEEPRDVGRIVLAVAVHRDDDVTGAVPDRRHQGCGLAIVARQMQHPDPRIALGDTVECFRRAVLRAVIGKNDLGRLRQPIERVGQRPMQFGERPHFVVDRNDDRNVHTAPPSRRRTHSSKP